MLLSRVDTFSFRLICYHYLHNTETNRNKQSTGRSINLGILNSHYLIKCLFKFSCRDPCRHHIFICFIFGNVLWFKSPQTVFNLSHQFNEPVEPAMINFSTSWLKIKRWHWHISWSMELCWRTFKLNFVKYHWKVARQKRSVYERKSLLFFFCFFNRNNCWPPIRVTGLQLHGHTVQV